VTSLSQINPVDVPAALDLLADPVIAEALVRRVIPLDDRVTEGLERLCNGTLSGKAIVVPHAVPADKRKN
jgi:hypothetical protein